MAAATPARRKWRSDALLVNQMLEYARRIQHSMDSVAFERWLSDVDLQDMTLRRIEIIGEAANQVSDSIKGAYPEVDWEKIYRARNIAVHGYDQIDFNIVWRIATEHIDALVPRLERIIAEQKFAGER